MDASDAVHDREEGNVSEHPVVESTSPAANLRSSGAKNIVVSGGGKEFGKQLKSIGGKWNAKERGYVFPIGKTDEVQALMDSMKTPEASIERTSSSTADLGVTPRAEMDTGGKGSSSGVDGGTSPAMDTVAADDLADPVVEGAPTKSSAAEDPVVDDTKSAVDEGGPSMAEGGEGVPESSATSAPAAPAYSTSFSSSSANPAFVIQLNTRSIAVLGDPPIETHDELNKHGKYNKAIKVGDDKRPGWTINKNFMHILSKLLPGISITPIDKLSAAAPIARSPSSRKSGSSSKQDTPEKEKRKRQRTTNAEEFAVQAHAPHAGEQSKIKA